MMRCVLFGVVMGRLIRELQANIWVGLLVVVLFSMLVNIEDNRIAQEGRHEA